MLIDLTFIPFTIEEQASYRESVEFYNKKYPDHPLPVTMRHPRRLAKGVYQAGNLIANHIYETIVDDDPPHMDYNRDLSIKEFVECDRAYRRKMNKLYSEKYNRGPFRYLGSYGLCDTPEQFFQMYPHIRDDDVPRVMTFNKITRESQSPTGGFRYHKNGKYIGKQKPRSEYLYDDQHIDFICSFHIYRVVDFSPKST